MIRSQYGFNLLELMITVMIVSILAAVAIPFYNDYTVRTRVTEGVAFAGAVKNQVSEYRMGNNSFPDTNSKVGIPNPMTSTYITNVLVTAGGVITVSFNASSGVPTGSVLQFTPTVEPNSGAILWSCSGAGTTIPDNLLPNECR